MEPWPVSFSLNKPLCLTSIPVPGPVRVENLCPAVARAVRVFVFGTVGPPEHFAGRGDIRGVPHLLVPVVPSWVALGRVFESLQTTRRQIKRPTAAKCLRWLACAVLLLLLLYLTTKDLQTNSVLIFNMWLYYFIYLFILGGWGVSTTLVSANLHLAELSHDITAVDSFPFAYDIVPGVLVILTTVCKNNTTLQ